MRRSLLVEERGTETVEWALIGGLILGGLVLVLTAIGLWIAARYENLQTNLEG